MYNYITFYNYEFGNFTILWVFPHLDNKSNKIIKLKFTFNLGHIDTLLFGGNCRENLLTMKGERDREKQKQRECIGEPSKGSMMNKRDMFTHKEFIL